MKHATGLTILTGVFLAALFGCGTEADVGRPVEATALPMWEEPALEEDAEMKPCAVGVVIIEPLSVPGDETGMVIGK